MLVMRRNPVARRKDRESLDNACRGVHCIGMAKEIRAERFQPHNATQEFTLGPPTAERTKGYFEYLVTLGVASQAADGELTGVAQDGTMVHLGHILKVSERADWRRLGAYLKNHPLPEHW